jgi:thymidylate kinase
MIIEIFGAPGTGKTKLAHALAERLRSRNYDARVLLSYVPGAYRTKLDPLGLVPSFARVLRAVFRFFGLWWERGSPSLAQVLIKSSPPRRFSWRLRLRLYLERLSEEWLQCDPSEIAIFDQGFIQAVCSLAAFSGDVDPTALHDALKIIPKGDLIIFLDADTRVLEGRLVERQSRESLLERLFEADKSLNLAMRPVVHSAAEILRQQSRKLLQFSNIDEESFSNALLAIENEIVIRAEN